MKRILTAAVLIPVVLLGIFSGYWWCLLGVIAIISILAYAEYSQMLKLPVPVTMLNVACGIAILVAPADLSFPAMIVVTLVALALPLRSQEPRAALEVSAYSFLGVFYVFGAMKTAYLLGLHNPWWLLLALAINWIGDTGAYYVGKQWGKRKLAPRISPGKSWEGAVASAVFSTVFFTLAAPRIIHIAVPAAAAIGLLGNVAGQLGDLAESALKRAAGVKDSGAMLPGHGGMLDRIDSALFTLPLVYIVMTYLVTTTYGL
jgi:phosphatidate cytidylyltransferase